jgi:hypothetical protein
MEFIDVYKSKQFLSSKVSAKVNIFFNSRKFFTKICKRQVLLIDFLASHAGFLALGGAIA